ncbi:UDP-N-acetylmuramate dehydrogenase [Thermodesulfovibrio hydrogeniphilus]
MRNIEIFCKERGITYKKDEPLANYTTLGIGGNAKIIVFPDDDNLLGLMEIIKNEGIPYYLIGGGSNLLISDRGFKGVIINTKKIDRIELKGFTLNVGAGAILGRVLAFLLKNNLSGMEGLIGIPGTVGGAVFGNAGSFGYETKDCLDEIEVIDENLNIKRLKRQEINFRYRSSGLPDSFIIKSAKFILNERGEEIFSKMKDFLARKRLSQPLNERSAGCVFKNPEGNSAGYLIDKAGLKGMRVGDIIVSSVHANYFINAGKGRADDFLKLMDIVKDKVFTLFSIELEPEIKYLEG